MSLRSASSRTAGVHPLPSSHADSDDWDTAPASHHYPVPPRDAFALRASPSAQDIAIKFAQLARDGELAQQNGSYEAAINHYDQALLLTGVPLEMQARVHLNLSRCFEATGDSRACRRHMTALVDCAERLNNDDMLCSALNNLGVVCLKQQDYDVAIETHQRALRLAGLLGDVRAQMRAHANIGNCYADQGFFSEAALHHEEQLHLAQRLEDSAAVARASLNLESDYASMRRYKEAEDYAKKKSKFSMRRVSLDTPLGDRRPGRTVWSGWLIKHRGGGLDAPTARRTIKRFCVLQKGIFSYSDSAAANKPASRYLRIEDILDVQPCEIYDDDSNLKNSRSFRIRTLHRAFYFSAASFEECREWIEAFQRARADVAHFAATRTWRGNSYDVASDRFGGRGGDAAHGDSDSLYGGRAAGGLSGNGSETTLQPISLQETLLQAPDGFRDNKQVSNPLFELSGGEADLLSSDEKTGAVPNRLRTFTANEGAPMTESLQFVALDKKLGYITLRNNNSTAFSLYGYRVALANRTIQSHAFGVRRVPANSTVKIWLMPGKRGSTAPAEEDDNHIFWRQESNNRPNPVTIPLSPKDGFVILDYDGHVVASCFVMDLVEPGQEASVKPPTATSDSVPRAFDADGPDHGLYGVPVLPGVVDGEVREPSDSQLSYDRSKMALSTFDSTGVDGDEADEAAALRRSRQASLRQIPMASNARRSSQDGSRDSKGKWVDDVPETEETLLSVARNVADDADSTDKWADLRMIATATEADHDSREAVEVPLDNMFLRMPATGDASARKLFHSSQQPHDEAESLVREPHVDSVEPDHQTSIEYLDTVPRPHAPSSSDGDQHHHNGEFDDSVKQLKEIGQLLDEAAQARAQGLWDLRSLRRPDEPLSSGSVEYGQAGGDEPRTSAQTLSHRPAPAEAGARQLLLPLKPARRLGNFTSELNKQDDIKAQASSAVKKGRWLQIKMPSAPTFLLPTASRRLPDERNSSEAIVSARRLPDERYSSEDTFASRRLPDERFSSEVIGSEDTASAIDNYLDQVLGENTSSANGNYPRRLLDEHVSSHITAPEIDDYPRRLLDEHVSSQITAPEINDYPRRLPDENLTSAVDDYPRRLPDEHVTSITSAKLVTAVEEDDGDEPPVKVMEPSNSYGTVKSAQVVLDNDAAGESSATDYRQLQGEHHHHQGESRSDFVDLHAAHDSHEESATDTMTLERRKRQGTEEDTIGALADQVLEMFSQLDSRANAPEPENNPAEPPAAEDTSAFLF